MNLLELFCSVDDFWQAHEPEVRQKALPATGKRRHRAGAMYPSEVMTIIIHFHQSQYRHFKAYYTKYVQVTLRGEFPKLVGYNRFVELMPTMLVSLWAYLREQYGQCSGISYIDLTTFMVCHNRRIHTHRVFQGIVQRGKSSLGWFYGFKLHVVVNNCGELLGCCLTTSNVDDREPVPGLAKRLFGKLFADRGYVSQALFEQLFSQHALQLITKLRKNMKNRRMLLEDKLLLRKRAIIETINDQLKNISQIEHTRHRSPLNLLVNLVAGLIAYCLQSKKPSLHIQHLDLVLP